mgnify:CR=1 FL=1
MGNIKRAAHVSERLASDLAKERGPGHFFKEKHWSASNFAPVDGFFSKKNCLPLNCAPKTNDMAMKSLERSIVTASFTCLLACQTAFIWAQMVAKPEISGLEAALSTAKTDTARLRILDQLGRSLIEAEPERAAVFFRKMDTLAVLARSAAFEARAAAQLSYYYGVEGKNAPAIYFGKKAVHLFDSLGDAKKLLSATENLSVVLIRAGNFKDAHALNLRLLDDQEKSGDLEGLFHTHQRIAVIYSEQKQKTDALRHDRLSLATAEKCNSDYLRATALGSIADDLSQWPDSARLAEFHYKKAIALFEKADTCPSCLAQFSAILSKFYLDMGRVDEAAFFVKKGLVAAKKTRDPFAQFETGTAAAQLSIVQNRLAEALVFLENAKEFKQVTSAAEVDFEKLWAQYYFSIGQPSMGFKRLQRAFSLQDSVAAEVYDEGISMLRVEHDTEKKEQETALLAVQNQGLKVKNNFFLALAALLGLTVLGGAWFFSRLRLQKKLIEEQNKTLENLNATKDKFFTIIAHDLRGPIVSFHGLIKKINWLIARGDTERVNQLGAAVDEAATGLNKLLDNLLAWALVQRGTMPFHPENIHLKTEAEQGVAPFKNALVAKNIDLHLDIDPEFQVFADRDALACFLRNLTDNALKYCPSGSKIEISAQISEGQTCISVADNGPGMAHELVERLLSEKSPNNIAFSSQGTGLGLMLCRELAELNQGKLGVTSQPGQGTTITVCLPVKAPATA